MRKQSKVKRASGEIIAVHEVSNLRLKKLMITKILEKNKQTVKNYGIVLRY